MKVKNNVTILLLGVQQLYFIKKILWKNIKIK